MVDRDGFDITSVARGIVEAMLIIQKEAERQNKEYRALTNVEKLVRRDGHLGGLVQLLNVNAILQAKVHVLFDQAGIELDREDASGTLN